MSKNRPTILLSAKSSGLTLIETLVSIGILSVLAALVFAGINSVREQARRTSCSNRLTQIGLATLNFEGANQHFPTGRWQAEILPYLDARSLETQFSEGIAPDDFGIFLCPSDSDNMFKKEDRLHGNYLSCFGTWMNENSESSGVISKYGGGVDSKPVRMSDIRDGISKTALASEALMGGGQYSGKDSRLRTLWITPGPAYLPVEWELLANACLGIPNDPIAAGWSGNSDVKTQLFAEVESHGVVSFVPTTGVGANLYNHILPPQNPSCLNGGGFLSGISTASSHHSGVVNIVFCDGHVESIDSGIDLKIWRELGTKNDLKEGK